MPCGWPFQWSVCPGYEFYTLRQGTQVHASLLSPSWWVFFYLAQNLLCLWPLLLCTKGGFISSKCTPIIFRWQFYQLLTHFSCQLPCWSKNCSFSSPTSSCKKGTLLGSWNILIPLKKLLSNVFVYCGVWIPAIPAYSPILIGPVEPCITDTWIEWVILPLSISKQEIYWHSLNIGKVQKDKANILCCTYQPSKDI